MKSTRISWLDLLARLQRILSTSTVRETVEESFREVLRRGREARQQEIEAPHSTTEGMDLDDPEVMDEA